MNRSINEGIRRGSLIAFFTLVAFLVIVAILSLFPQESAGSLKDEVDRMTVANTERHLLAVTDKVSNTSRVVRDGVVNTNNDGSIKVTISLRELTNTIEE